MTETRRQIITRKEAMEQGLARYFTGKPCKKGHISERFASNSTCITCCQEQSAATKRANRPIYTEYDQTWRTVNWEQHEENYKRYYEENKSEHREYMIEYKEQNTERVQEQNRRNKREHYKYNSNAYIQRAARRQRELENQYKSLTNEERQAIDQIYLECKKMNTDSGFIKYHVDHIKPLAKGGKHHPDNLRIITAHENRSKGAKYEPSVDEIPGVEN